MSRPAQIIVVAKAPVPGRAKTRLSPPCTPEQAAGLAAAALADTLAAVRAVPGVRRIAAFDGDPAHPDVDLAGFEVLPQRGDGLGERLAHAFADAGTGDGAGRVTLLIGMDTPQIVSAELAAALALLDDADAVLGMATDGGWWALGLADAGPAAVLAGVPMSADDTGTATLAALHDRGLHVRALRRLSDVDTIEDAAVVAGQAPASRFAAALDAMMNTVSMTATGDIR